MKRFLSAVTALSMLCLCSCGNKTGSSAENSSQETTAAVNETTAETSETQTETVAAVTETVTSAQTSAVTDAVATTVPVTTPKAEQPGSYHKDENGAVITDVPAAEMDDAALIAAAQALFETACETQWNYTVGCPFAMDNNTYINVGQFGWQFFLVTEPGINSIADVEAEYHKVFSDRYPNSLSETFAEEDQHVYCLAGSRGSNIFYLGSEIVSVDSRTDDEIFFTVHHSYNYADYGIEPMEPENETFSVVIEPDGTWKAGQFRLPY